MQAFLNPAWSNYTNILGAVTASKALSLSGKRDDIFMITGAHVVCSFHNMLNSMNSLGLVSILEVDGFCIVLVIKHNVIYAWSTQKPNLGPVLSYWGCIPILKPIKIVPISWMLHSRSCICTLIFALLSWSGNLTLQACTPSSA